MKTACSYVMVLVASSVLCERVPPLSCRVLGRITEVIVGNRLARYSSTIVLVGVYTIGLDVGNPNSSKALRYYAHAFEKTNERFTNYLDGWMQSYPTALPRFSQETQKDANANAAARLHKVRVWYDECSACFELEVNTIGLATSKTLLPGL